MKIKNIIRNMLEDKKRLLRLFVLSLVGILAISNFAENYKESKKITNITFYDAVRSKEEPESIVKSVTEDFSDDELKVQAVTELSYNNGFININTADSTELQRLSGIGPSKAQSIIDYRQKYGNFVVIDEITEVSGIGEKTFEKIKDKICVN